MSFPPVRDRRVGTVVEALHLVKSREHRLEPAAGRGHQALETLQGRELPACLTPARLGIDRQEVIGFIEEKKQAIPVVRIKPLGHLPDHLVRTDRPAGPQRQDTAILQPLSEYGPQRDRFLSLADRGGLQVKVDGNVAGPGS